MNPDICITILIDNATTGTGLGSEHGLSLWIEYKGKKILFDTGQSNLLIQNAEKLDIDLSKTNAIVLSHGHHDHTGGLIGVLNYAPRAHVYFNHKAIEAKYSCKNGGPRYIGIQEQIKQQLVHKFKFGEATCTNNKTLIFNGAAVTGQVPRRNDYEDTGGYFYNDKACTCIDSLVDDQSLFFECPKGLVVILGCSHSGVVNTLDYISELTDQKKIYAAIGGMHMVNAGTQRIEKTISAFRKYDIQKIVPLHCTGLEAMEKIKEEFAERCLLLGAGDKICF